jgi:ribosomal protein S18 acetylase RimI-like enzyme
MAYTRWPESGHYIYGGVDYVDFNGVVVNDDAVDVFIYKLFSERGSDGDEFMNRCNHGKRIIENFLKGIRVKKLTKHTPDLEKHTAAIATLADEIWHEHFTPIIGAAQVDYMLAKYQTAERIYSAIRKEDYTYFTAKDIDQDRLLGYCGVAPRENYMLLSKLYIHREFRGKGVARCFMEEATAMCQKEYGFDKIRLTVNKHNESAIDVYKKIGFTVIDSVKADIGGGFFMDDYVMEHILS